MGKASKRKKESGLETSQAKKILKQLKRESSPDAFMVNGKKVYFNPLKKILEGEKYKTDEGRAVTKEMVQQYEQFLKRKMMEYKEKKDGNTGSGNKSKN